MLISPGVKICFSACSLIFFLVQIMHKHKQIFRCYVYKYTLTHHTHKHIQTVWYSLSCISLSIPIRFDLKICWTNKISNVSCHRPYTDWMFIKSSEIRECYFNFVHFGFAIHTKQNIVRLETVPFQRFIFGKFTDTHR